MVQQFKLDPRVETNHDGPLGQKCWLIPLAGYQEYRAETSKESEVTEHGHNIKSHTEKDLASLQAHVWKQDLTGDSFFQKK